MRLFSYIITDDTGFAPNPFWGYCTLACCKPKIRSVAMPGDLVVGLSPSHSGNRLVYAMRVSERLSFKEYFNDKRFSKKKPDINSPDPKRRCGDNIYEPTPSGSFRQLKSPFHNEENLSINSVLVSMDFCYFGVEAKRLPAKFSYIIAKRGHRSKFSQEQIIAFETYFGTFKWLARQDGSRGSQGNLLPLNVACRLAEASFLNENRASHEAN